MSLKIRLTRLGDKKNPFYRVVVMESRSSRDGEYIAQIGTYNPTGDDKDAIKIDNDKATEWLAKGATPTDTVKSLLIKSGVLEREKPKIKKATAKKPVEADKTTKK